MHGRIWRTRIFAALLALVLPTLHTAAFAADDEDADAPRGRTVKSVADSRITVIAKGENLGELPLYISADWTRPLPGITRAVLVLHGRLRNADVYFRSALTAQQAAGDIGKAALMIVPQFLSKADVRAWQLSPETLHWTTEGWEGGEPAQGPSDASSFEALDSILARLADRTLFPDLKQVVIAGHSGGGQVVQRYAITAKGEAALARAGVAVRYVVANPSSYAYFDNKRPEPAIAASCQGYNDWKYGMDHRPPYVANASIAELEKTYVSRRVIYLLGTEDTNPQHSALDKSCMGEAEGPYRYIRGHTYFDLMKARNNGTPNHNLWDVLGVGHNGDKMLTSACGLKALFDLPGCEGK
ncbi:MAG TPA: alpha/beta hydrolase [Rhizomicrobium sp.]|jgi:hypothetical protein